MEDKPRYSRVSDILDLITYMLSKVQGITIPDIMERYNVSRRTAERMRDSLLNIFPDVEEIEVPEDDYKHWGFSNRSLSRFAKNHVTFVPVCGGAMHAFFRTVRINLSLFTYVGVDGDMTEDKRFCLFSTLKHIDWVMEDYIGKWLNGLMPKHQTLGLADGVTDVVYGNYTYGEYLNSRLMDNLLDMDSLRQVAIRKEGERYEK